MMIKTMNNKMAKNANQQLNLKNILSKQEEQRANHGYGEFLWLPEWGGCVGEGVKR